MRKYGEPYFCKVARSKTPTEPRAPLTKERIVEAAVALAQREGLEALTMRRLADELGAGAMSLYHYVPNKEVLLDAMIDVVFGEIELPTTDVDWRTALRRRALSTREALNRHRWAVGLMESPTTPGPNSARLHDAVLGCLREAGFSIEDTIQAYSVQDAYIYGFALQEIDMSSETPEDFAAEAQRQMRDYAAVLGDYPHLVEVVGGHVAKAGYDYAGEFLFGLDVILDGLERLLDS
jgi:AcrR family transcriptional regulator